MRNASFPQLAFPRLWQSLAAVATVAVATLSLIPRPPQPPGPLAWDKGQHALAYLVLGAAWLQSTRGIRWGLTLAGVLCLGLILELLQGLGNARHLQAADMVANGLGVAIGAGLCLTPLGRALGYFDRGLARLVGHAG